MRDHVVRLSFFMAGFISAVLALNLWISDSWWSFQQPLSLRIPESAKELRGRDDEWIKITLGGEYEKGRFASVGADDGCRSWTGSPLCYIEAPEHTLVKKWIPQNAAVMEFGARFGTTTCEIAKQLNNSGKVVAVEPDRGVWGILTQNLEKHACRSHVVLGGISSTPLLMLGSGYGGRSDNTLGSKSVGGRYSPTFSFDEVEEAIGFKIDTLLIDCEGCAQFMMDQLKPKLKKQIQLILLEADMPMSKGDCKSNCMNYTVFFDVLEGYGFEKVDQFNDCDRSSTGAPNGTWCGPWIDHYAFKRRGN